MLNAITAKSKFLNNHFLENIFFNFTSTRFFLNVSFSCKYAFPGEEKIMEKTTFESLDTINNLEEQEFYFKEITENQEALKQQGSVNC